MVCLSLSCIGILLRTLVLYTHPSQYSVSITWFGKVPVSLRTGKEECKHHKLWNLKANLHKSFHTLFLNKVFLDLPCCRFTKFRTLTHANLWARGILIKSRLFRFPAKMATAAKQNKWLINLRWWQDWVRRRLFLQVSDLRNNCQSTWSLIWNRELTQREGWIGGCCRWCTETPDSLDFRFPLANTITCSLRRTNMTIVKVVWNNDRGLLIQKKNK